MKEVHAVYVGRGIIEAVSCIFFSSERYEKVFARVTVGTEKDRIRIAQMLLPRSRNLYAFLVFRMGAPQMTDGFN